MKETRNWVIGLLALAATLAPASRAIAASSHGASHTNKFQGIANSAKLSASAPRTNVYLGVSVRQWSSDELLANLTGYQTSARKNAALVMYWLDWAKSGQVDPRVMNAIYGQGSVPVISWAPKCWSCSDQSPYTLNRIIQGAFDGYVRTFAATLRSYGRPVLLRFAPEMNGCWDTYSCQPTEFVAAWRHVHDLFVQQRATNVQWVWCPNIDWDGNHAVAPYYPGDAYVNWLGLDGYNRTWDSWQSFGAIFQSSMRELSALSRTAPIMIGETASAEATPAQAQQGLSKAGWITDAYANGIPSFPQVKAVVWFDQDKSAEEGCPCDWRVSSSGASLLALANAVASPQYLSRWF